MTRAERRALDALNDWAFADWSYWTCSPTRELYWQDQQAVRRAATLKCGYLLRFGTLRPLTAARALKSEKKKAKARKK
jgi:hypothetical protein